MALSYGVALVASAGGRNDPLRRERHTPFERRHRPEQQLWSPLHLSPCPMQTHLPPIPGDVLISPDVCMQISEQQFSLLEQSLSSGKHTSSLGENEAGDKMGGDSASGDSVGGDSVGGDSVGGDSVGGDPEGGDPVGGNSVGGNVGGEATSAELLPGMITSLTSKKLSAKLDSSTMRP